MSKQQTLSLTVVTDPWHVEIGGDIANADLALAVLQEATRYFTNGQLVVILEQREQMKAKQAMAAMEHAGILHGIKRPS